MPVNGREYFLWHEYQFVLKHFFGCFHRCLVILQIYLPVVTPLMSWHHCVSKWCHSTIRSQQCSQVAALSHHPPSSRTIQIIHTSARSAESGTWRGMDSSVTGSCTTPRCIHAVDARYSFKPRSSFRTTSIHDMVQRTSNICVLCVGRSLTGRSCWRNIC